MKIGLVTVTFNSSSVLDDFFVSIKNQDYNNFKLYIVDNASSDDTIDKVEKWDCHAKILLKNNKNIGVSSANNQGINLALNDNCDFILLINNDGANLVGTTIFNFNDVNTFYTSFQILKKNRKKMKQMQLDYVYNFNTKSITFENPRVDGKQNQKLDEFLNIFNSEQDRIFNKITFKNFMNNFFNAYAG